jgi:death on curing protein
VEITLAVHDRQLAEHGGGTGMRDRNILESALARPVDRVAAGDDNPATLAAAYAFGIARNHVFVDGNKRTAWVLAPLFLDLNGHVHTFTAGGAIATTLALAAGDTPEDKLADWFCTRLSPSV